MAAVHGLSVLLLDGPLASLPEERADAAVARVLDAVADGPARQPHRHDLLEA